MKINWTELNKFIDKHFLKLLLLLCILGEQFIPAIMIILKWITIK